MKLFDGGMGTMLQKYGLTSGDCPDYYNISHPEIIQKIHREYVKAGSDYITTNTFGASPMKLSHYDLSNKTESIAEAAINNARIAIGKKPIQIAGDIGPTGRFIQPLGDVTFDEMCENFYRTAKALVRYGADCLIIETMIEIQEIRAALIACKAVSHLPVICQMTYSDDGRTITGTDPASATILLDAMGADIIGANCSLGPDKLRDTARIIASVTNKPIIIQSNAGIPILDENGDTLFPLSPDEFASYTKEFHDIGVSYLGGCCGTTPAHIAALKSTCATLPPIARTPIAPFTALTSRTETVYIGDAYRPVQIGERINPTGRKKMREELQKGIFTFVKKEALAQVDAGADILDVNMGIPNIDQSALMERAITELSVICPVPFSLDSTNAIVLEKALKVYPGRALINSVNAEDMDNLHAILKLAKIYGAAVLCLPIEKRNLPETAEERIRVIHTIVDAAKKEGLRKEDLLLDPLVLTSATSTNSGKETLRTLQLYKQEFGFPCVMGASNVSFGLPSRPLINATFLAMALACGLHAPIINPLDPTIQDVFATSRLLLGFDRGAKNWISYTTHKEKSYAPKVATTNSENVPPLERIKSAVKRGEKEEAATLIASAVATGLSPDTIIKNGLTDAMTETGDAYGEGKIYLPQVMMAAEAMQSAFTALKELLPNVKTKPKGTFLIGTVAGDIHDLGKNIVSALLQNSNYHVIDLGKDVSSETFIEAIRTHHTDVIGLCSLMTTTLPEMESTLVAIRKRFPHIPIIVGGAVVTPDYASNIGASAYAKDGIDAIRQSDRLLQERNPS